MDLSDDPSVLLIHKGPIELRPTRTDSSAAVCRSPSVIIYDLFLERENVSIKSSSLNGLNVELFHFWGGRSKTVVTQCADEMENVSDETHVLIYIGRI